MMMRVAHWMPTHIHNNEGKARAPPQDAPENPAVEQLLTHPGSAS